MNIQITSFSSLTPLSKNKPKFNSDLYNNKKIHSTNKNTLDVTPKIKAKKPNIIKTQLSLKTTSNVIQPSIQANKKGVLLYQQIEGDKIFLNGNELTNRFQFKV